MPANVTRVRLAGRRPSPWLPDVVLQPAGPAPRHPHVAAGPGRGRQAEPLPGLALPIFIAILAAAGQIHNVESDF